MKYLAQNVLAVLATLLLLCGAPAPASAQGGIAVKLESADLSRPTQATIRLTVTDENGLPVPDLTVESFEITEDGRASSQPVTVESVSDEKTPVSVLILLDLSATMQGEPLRAARQAAAGFLDKLLKDAGDPDRAAFIGFGKDVDIKALTLSESNREAPFTNDEGRLLNVINFVEAETSAGTPLYDALYRAIKIVAGQSTRRAIIVMTDGRDTGSILKDNDPIDEARRQRVPIFPVGLSNSRLDAAYLKRLAELTGGQYEEAPKPADLTQKFEDVLAQLKVQYILTYKSSWSKDDSQTHSLLVRVKSPRGQGFDEIKVQPSQPTATPAGTGSATPPAATATPHPPASGTPALTPTATPEGKMLSNITTWISDNTLLAAGIGAAALLFLMLIILALALRRRRAPAPVAPAVESAPYVSPPAPEAPAAPPWRTGDVEAGAATGGAGPAEGGTWVAPIEQPVAPAPFRFPGAPPARDEVEAGGTIVLPRGSRPKALGFLVERKQPGRRYDVDKPSVTIGRAPGNAIVIDDPTVSRQHAAIKLEAGQFRIYDLGSANGTFVGEQRVRDPLVLEDGASVRLGDVELIFKRVSLE
jgi:VWFA-related protein